jgi:pilus assembly protein CpaE
MSAPPTPPRPARSPFLAFVGDAQDQETLKAFAGVRGWPDSGVLQGDIGTAVEFLGKHASPTLLVIEVKDVDAASAQLDALANACEPDTKVVIVGSVNEYSFYCWLMDIGIFSYLLKPLTLAALEGMWQKASEPPPATAKSAREPGRVIGLIGTRGGVGVTSLSIALAACVAGQGKRTALVDLDPQDGSVSLLLDLEPSRGFREALEKPDRIDNLFLDRVMNKAEAGMYVLSAEEGLNERVQHHEHAAEALLKELREKFEVVVLDLPRTVNPFYRNCLKLCDQVAVVSDLTLQGLRDGLRLADLFRDFLKIKPPLFIANRAGFAPKFEMTPADYAKGLKQEVKFHVPFAPEIFMDLTASLKETGAPALKTVRQIAQALLPELAGDDGAPEKRTLPMMKLFKK